MFVLKISTDHDVFQGEDGTDYLARLIANVASEVAANPLLLGRTIETSRIKDSNGNTVGEWILDMGHEEA